MNYSKLTKEDFDAVVTGELTHYAIWLEETLSEIIANHFVPLLLQDDFKRLILRRDGLTFQGKIDITRGMIPLFTDKVAVAGFPKTLMQIEEFKAKRNAFAHGHDVTPANLPSLALHIETVSRSGKARIEIVTPESHRALLEETSEILKALEEIRDRLWTHQQQSVLEGLTTLLSKVGEPSA